MVKIIVDLIWKSDEKIPFLESAKLLDALYASAEKESEVQL